jgi:hypothetical protein
MRAEVNLGRVINPERAGQERTQLTRGIVLALRELAQKTDIDAETRDLAAFIGLALWAVWEGIEATIAPWEKRGYWIKADRFRMEWAWSQNLGLELQLAVLRRLDAGGTNCWESSWKVGACEATAAQPSGDTVDGRLAASFQSTT